MSTNARKRKAIETSAGLATASSLTAPRAAHGWLPQINPSTAPRLNALLKPGPAAADHDSSPLLAGAGLEDAFQGHATDIHFEPFSRGWRIRFRIDGQIHDVAQLEPALGQKMVRCLRTLAGLNPVISNSPQDASFQFPTETGKMDVRLSCTPCEGGERVSLRLLNPQRLQRRTHDLGLDKANLELLKRWAKEAVGMCLLTGPAGSGKTTTLYGLLHELELCDHVVITVEDPVEYPIDGLTQIRVNPDHGLTFAAGLKAMLRLDPDYLIVGEMRDAASAETAVEAAASGHFVISTLHSADAAGVVTLLRGWGLPDHQIATVLQIVVNQRLVRRLCPECRKAAKTTKGERTWFESLRLPAPDTVWRPVGCAACQNTGFRGRIGVFEVWHKRESDYRLLLAHTDEHRLRRNLRRRGLQTVHQDAMSKVRLGITSLSELQQMGAHLGWEGRVDHVERKQRR